MKLKPWAKMPTEWIQDGRVRSFRWKEDGSAATAALMLYFAFCQFASERPLRPSEIQEPALRNKSKLVDTLEEALPDLAAIHVVPSTNILHMLPSAIEPELQLNPNAAPDIDALVARLTYDELNVLTGLSRERISAGLKKLVDEQMIWRLDGSGSYGLTGFGAGKRWAKLPGSALTSVGGTSFLPFSHFKLRSKHELNALKMHLYFAHVRDKAQAYSEVSFETIFKRLGVQERDIPIANSLLLSCGILVRTKAMETTDAKQHGANNYYLNGYTGFFIKKTS